MTVEERFERIEHITAALVEERRKDREEHKQLWRDSQRQIAELTQKIAETNVAVTRFAEESREADRRLGERIDELGRHLGQRIDDLGVRVDSLVSAIGAYIAASKKSEYPS